MRAVRIFTQGGHGYRMVMLMLWSALWWYMAPHPCLGPGRRLHRRQGRATSWHPEQGEPLFVLVLGSDARVGPPDGGGGRCDCHPHRRDQPAGQGRHDPQLPPRLLRAGEPGWAPPRSTPRAPGAAVRTWCRTLKSLTGINIQYYVITEFSHFVAIHRRARPHRDPGPLPHARPLLGRRLPAGRPADAGRPGAGVQPQPARHPAGRLQPQREPGDRDQGLAQQVPSEANTDSHRIFEYMRIGSPPRRPRTYPSSS